MIGKELFSLVLDIDIQELEEINQCESFIEVRRNEIVLVLSNLHYAGVPCPSKKDWITINIHELAHKCKEWARLTHNIDLITLRLKEGWLCCDWYDKHTNLSSNCNTEPEAIFQACQWILDKDQQ